MGAAAFIELLRTHTLCMQELGCFGDTIEAHEMNPAPPTDAGYGVLVHGTVLAPSRNAWDVSQKLQSLKANGGVRAVPLVAGTLVTKHSSRYRFVMACEQQRDAAEDAKRSKQLYDFMSSRGGPWAEASQTLAQAHPLRIGQVAVSSS